MRKGNKVNHIYFLYVFYTYMLSPKFDFHLFVTRYINSIKRAFKQKCPKSITEQQ